MISARSSWLRLNRPACGIARPGSVAHHAPPRRSVGAAGGGCWVSVTNSWDDIPELGLRVPNPVPHGVDWPVVPESNRQFLLELGIPSVCFARRESAFADLPGAAGGRAVEL